MKFLLFAGSLRKDSFNRKLLAVAADILKQNGEQFEIADLAVCNFPVYNADIEATGIPESVKKFSAQILDHDALIVCSPEYNGGIASPLKNALDWVSRIQPVAWRKKPLLLMAASPGALGGVRALWHSRVPMEALGIQVYADMFGLSLADKAFDDVGQLKDPKTKDRVTHLVNDYVVFAKKIAAK
jgi:chromate reductase